jgi:hypothetical protein
MDEQVLACRRFVHEAGAMAGLAGLVCGLAAAQGVSAPRAVALFLRFRTLRVLPLNARQHLPRATQERGVGRI